MIARGRFRRRFVTLSQLNVTRSYVRTEHRQKSNRAFCTLKYSAQNRKHAPFPTRVFEQLVKSSTLLSVRARANPRRIR